MNLLQNTHYQILEEKYLRKLLCVYAGKNVLDVGCGQGKYLRLLQEIGCEGIGVDINPNQINALKAEGFIAYTPENLPKNKKYDLILMAHVIEHMEPQELVQFLDTYLPMLSKAGKLIVLTPVLGARFYYDPTHIRPYYPQSLWMLMGGLDTPAAFRTQIIMNLEDICFFKDSWRLREVRSFYPVPEFNRYSICKKICQLTNYILAFLHHISAGKLGTTASWLGIYGHKNK